MLSRFNSFDAFQREEKLFDQHSLQLQQESGKNKSFLWETS